MKRCIFIMLLLAYFNSFVYAGTYYVNTATDTIDGDTFCDGVCGSDDTIILMSGARGGLLIRDFNGSGSYITITNEDSLSNEQVVIDGYSGWGCLSIYNCKYIKLQGNNEPAQTYGIKVINDATSQKAGSVWIYGDSDYIEISYLEVTLEGNPQSSGSGNGIFLQDQTLTASVIMESFNIHHNYIHDTRYAGMYIGHNSPWSNNYPYIANISIHDNILENLGSYGLNAKGVHSTSSYVNIYNNTVDNTGLVYVDADNSAHTGYSLSYYAGNAYANVYNNTATHTKGACVRVQGSSTSPHQIYGNVLCACGTGNDETFGNGVSLIENANADIEDNIIIQPTRYGNYADITVDYATDSRNKIGDAGLGERYVESGGIMTEGTGEDANVYHADVADFNFAAWSDDSNYSNDRFMSSNLIPLNNALDVSVSTNLTWNNAANVTGVDVYFEKDDSTPDVKVIDNADVEIYNPPEDLNYDSTYYWRIVSHGFEETGPIYSFITESEGPLPTILPPVNFRLNY